MYYVLLATPPDGSIRKIINRAKFVFDLFTEKKKELMRKSVN